MRAWNIESEIYIEGRLVPNKRGRASKKNFSGERTRKHDRVSGRNACPAGPEKLCLHFMSGQT